MTPIPEFAKAQGLKRLDDLERDFNDGLSGVPPETTTALAYMAIPELINDLRIFLAVKGPCLHPDVIARTQEDGSVILDWPEGATETLVSRDRLDELMRRANHYNRLSMSISKERVIDLREYRG